MRKRPSSRPPHQARRHPLVEKKNGNEMDADKRNIKRCTGPEHHQAVLSMDESPPSWWACDHLRKKLTHEQSPLMSAASTTRLVCSIR